MPRNVNPASISVGAGIAPQGTVEDNSLRNPQRDVEPLRAHLLDPNNAHMAATIGIVDAGGFYTSTDVEGALQEIGGGGAAGRHNGLVIGGTFTSGAGLLTLDTPTTVLIGGALASFGGATVVLPPSVTRYVWIDPTTSILTASAGLPPVSNEPVLIAKVTTDAGANVTSSQDARFFVANLDRKLDYTLRSDGTAVNDASEACFVTLDAALFWLSNYVATGQESKTVIVVRGNHTINSTVVVPAGVPNIEFRGEGIAAFVTGAVLSPMFDVSGTTGVAFTNLTFRCDHAGSVAIATNNPALACFNVTVQNCIFGSGAGIWGRGVRLYQGTPATQTGHRVLDSQFVVSASGVLIDRAVDCVVRDCTMTGNNTAGSLGVALTRIAGAGENCLVDNVRASNFVTAFSTSTNTTTLRKCLSSSGGNVVGGVGAVVDGCFFASITDTTAGLSLPVSAIGAVVSNTTVASTTVWAAPDNPSGISVNADGVVITNCSVSGFYNAAGGNGTGVLLTNHMNNKVVATDISNCYFGVVVVGTASSTTVDNCTIAAKVRGVFTDPTTSGVRVTNSTILLDPATGVEGVVVLGGESFVLGCKITTARAFNSYAPGDIPAGVTCGTSGPYLIEGCSFTNFYDSTLQQGGGVCSGDVFGLTVSGCTFINGGINLGGTNLNSIAITGCTFNANAALLNHLGVTVFAATALFDVNVTGCVFNFNSNDTYYGVDVSTPGGLNRLVVANCTYTNTVAPAGTEAFVRVSVLTGEEVIIEGNSVSYPTAYSIGCIDISGVGSVTLTGNTVVSDNPSVSATALRVQAKTVTYTGNTVVGMRGIALIGVAGFLPSLAATGNTFDGADDTTMVGVYASSVGGAPVTAFNTVFTGNVFTGCVTAVDFTTVGTLTLNRFTFTGNTISGCRRGLLTDADTANTVSVSDNTFYIYDYAFFYNKATATYTNVTVDGNTVAQDNFVGPVVAQGLFTLLGTDVANLSVSDNQFDHAGNVGGVFVSISGVGARDIAVDGNTVRHENATNNSPLVVVLSATNVVSPLVSNVSMSRNTVRHFGNSFDAIRMALSGTVAGVVFRNVRMDDNSVTVEENNPSNEGVTLAVSGTIGGVFPAVRGVSMCRNEVRAFGPSVYFNATDVGVIENALICDNSAVAGNLNSLGAIFFNCGYTGGVSPGTALVDNLTVSRNAVKTSESNYAVRVTCLAPVTNLSVDDNSVVQVGNVANVVLGSGNVYLSLPNTSAFGTRDAATGVSVCRNKVSGVTNVNYGEAAILLTSPGGLTTEGKNIVVDGNEVFNHVGAAIKVNFGYDALHNLSVSGNNIQQALAAGGAAGDGTIEVDLNGGGGFVLSGNRLGVTSRKGIYIDGGSATSELVGVTLTGNTVDFTGGAGAAEEGMYVFWQQSLATVTVTGNTVRGANAGIYVDGGRATSGGLNPSLVRGVTVTGNSLTAGAYGVWVSNHTTNSGLGTATLDGVVVSNNTIAPILAAGAMSYGVLVDTVFGTLDRVTVSGNTVNVGTTSTGNGVAVDANDAVPTQVSVTDNSTVNGYRGVYVLGNGNERFSDFSVCRNRVLDANSIGVQVTGMGSLRNLAVDDNSVQNVDALAFTGQGVSVNSSSIQNNTFNVSVSGNSIDSTQGQGIFLQLLRSANNPEARNISVCNNRISNWNESGAYASTVSAITVNTSIAGANAHALYNLNVSNNNCMDVTNDYVSGFSFSLDEKTRQVVFAHNQVLLGNQANAAAMAWTFTNTGGNVPFDFSFMGNQFRDTNGAVPVYTAGTLAKYATFYGNIGSAANFWTGFAGNWSVYVPTGAIATHNIDDGTV